MHFKCMYTCILKGKFTFSQWRGELTPNILTFPPGSRCHGAFCCPSTGVSIHYNACNVDVSIHHNACNMGSNRMFCCAFSTWKKCTKKVPKTFDSKRVWLMSKMLMRFFGEEGGPHQMSGVTPKRLYKNVQKTESSGVAQVWTGPTFFRTKWSSNTLQQHTIS